MKQSFNRRTAITFLVIVAMVGAGCTSQPQPTTRSISTRPRILFIGSSSIFYWRTLETDFADVPGRIERNGKGSRTLADIAAHAQDEIIAKSPDKVLVYAGSIDLHDHARSPRDVFDDFVGICDQIHGTLPHTKVYFISCKPSIAKWEGIAADQELNRMVLEFASRERDVIYIDVWEPMLDSDGNPVEFLFAKDKNHLSKEGYMMWTRVIRPYLVR